MQVSDIIDTMQRSPKQSTIHTWFDKKERTSIEQMIRLFCHFLDMMFLLFNKNVGVRAWTTFGYYSKVT